MKEKNTDIRILHHKRHVRIWKSILTIFGPGLKWFFRLKSTVFKGDAGQKIAENFMVISNHCTSYDPVMIALSFPQHMYFVAGNHVFKSGVWSRLLSYCFAPIGRQKSQSATAAIVESMKCLRAGFNVCIFAEGNCSYNGQTSPILPSTGKMIKKSGCGLVTYHFEGGYFMAPRWSLHRRRGPIKGYPVSYLTAAELADMSVEEINAVIQKDLWEDAFARQDTEHNKYKGRLLAEALETLLYICPKCHRISTMESHDDILSCSCGLKVRYDVYGFLHDETKDNRDGCFYEFPVTYKSGITITEWDNYQRDALFHLADRTPEDAVLFRDAHITLYKSNTAEERIPLSAGTLSMSAKEIRLVPEDSGTSPYIFPLDAVIGFTTCNRSGLIFMFDKVCYELRAKHKFCALKYFDLYNHLQRKHGTFTGVDRI